MYNDNIAIIDAFVTDVWSNGKLGRIPELMHEDYAAEGRVVGLDWVRRNVTTYRNALPNLQVEILTSSCARTTWWQHWSGCGELTWVRGETLRQRADR